MKYVAACNFKHSGIDKKKGEVYEGDDAEYLLKSGLLKLEEGESDAAPEAAAEEKPAPQSNKKKKG